MTIPLHAFDVLTSTSDKASELLDEGAQAPFAVLARRQTAGRGRRGHSWQSDEGNLFLTLVLPPPPNLAEKPGLIALLAAAAAAGATESLTLVRPTIKWPNDLLFAGAKFAGILCESTFASGRLGEVLVGIGINMTSAPKGLPYPATSLAEITGRTISSEAMTEALLASFAAIWETAVPASVTERFASFGVEAGQPWRSAAGEGVSLGVDLDGALLIQKAEAPTLRLTSVDSGWSWRYQETAAALLVADIGNTATKLGAFEGGSSQCRQTWRIRHGDPIQPILAEVLTRLAERGGGRPVLHLISVNPPASALFRIEAQRAGFACSDIPKRRLRSHGPYPLSQLGIDRLAAAEGYLASRPAGPGAVIVGVGTATTLDVVMSDGRHLGGYIVPGPAACLGVLADRTVLLPRLTWEAPENSGAGVLPRSTADAMLRGVLRMQAAFVTAVADEAANLGGGSEALRTIFFGGDAAPLAHAVGGDLIDPLPLLGARAMVLGGTL